MLGKRQAELINWLRKERIVEEFDNRWWMLDSRGLRMHEVTREAKSLLKREFVKIKEPSDRLELTDKSKEMRL